MNIKAKVTKVKITSNKISMIALLLKNTGLDLVSYELIDSKSKIIGYQFFEDDYSLQKVLKQLEVQPVLSSVSTDIFERHVYQTGSLRVDVNIFFSKENRGTFLVISPYAGL
jgi:rRNA maturation endonuclease Nob1